MRHAQTATVGFLYQAGAGGRGTYPSLSATIYEFLSLLVAPRALPALLLALLQSQSSLSFALLLIRP
jgi:hypothetical protein